MHSLAIIFWLGAKELRSFLRDSRRITEAFLPPYFRTPQPIAEQDVIPLNAGRLTFVIDIPPNFERDVLAGREPQIQLDVDATAMVQAGLGGDYADQIMTTEIGRAPRAAVV